MSIKKSGLIIGLIVLSIGIYSLISNLGFKPIEIDETIPIDDSKSYEIYSDQHGEQKMRIVGEKFDLELISPGDGLQIPKKSHSKETYLEWTHLQDGKSFINIQNTGSNELHVLATFEVTPEPNFLILTFVIIIVGMIIVGFSTKSTKVIKESSDS